MKSIAHKLADALRPFVDAHEAAAEPIGDSDLDNEQPRRVLVTLGDCRKAYMALAEWKSLGTSPAWKQSKGRNP